MTHGELLDAINRQIITAPPFALGGYTKFLQGLSAVVELHSPLDNLIAEFCSHCTEMSGEDIYTLYPCLTIKAIEKELE
jgi:hypothetical protein